MTIDQKLPTYESSRRYFNGCLNCWCQQIGTISQWAAVAAMLIVGSLGQRDLQARQTEPTPSPATRQQAAPPVDKTEDTDNPASDTKDSNPKLTDVGPATSTSRFGVSIDEPVTTRWKVGAKIRTGGGPTSNVLLTFPLPANWPEQSVTVLAENIPTDIGYVVPRQLDSNVQQIVVKFPLIEARETVEISYTLEVRNRPFVAPQETHLFVVPKKSLRQVKPFLATSKNVNYKNSQLRKQTQSIIAEHESAWDQTSAIYNWVRQNIQVESTAFHSATHTFKNKSGTNEDKTFLFVAMCRSVKIPARIVFAKGLAYAEFMLQDPDSEKLHWFPCNVSGIREFGERSEPRVILQKGDGIRVPEKQSKQKYVAEFVACEGRVRPRIGFFRAEIFDDQEPDQ